MKRLANSIVIRTALTMSVAFALSGGLTGCVSKAKYNKAISESEACQQRSSQQEQRLSQIHSLLKETHAGVASNEDNREISDEQMIAEVRQILNQQNSELASYRNGTGTTAQQVSFKLLAKYLFPSGSANLTPDGRAALDKVASWLKSSDSRHIFVAGYTDDVPIGKHLKRTYASNWELSAQRATVVTRFMVDNGVEADRIVAMGYGDNNPTVAEYSEDARQQNRRIEIRLNDSEFNDTIGKLPETVPQTALIDVNRATVAELLVLPGVSPDVARSIVDYRARAGRFTSYDDLKQVRGFDSEKLAPVQSMVTFGGGYNYSSTEPGFKAEEGTAASPMKSDKDMILAPKSDTDTYRNAQPDMNPGYQPDMQPGTRPDVQPDGQPDMQPQPQ